jgi:hypothetical protein
MATPWATPATATRSVVRSPCSVVSAGIGVGTLAKSRAADAAAARGSIAMSQADLDAAVGVIVPRPPVAAELRTRVSLPSAAVLGAT